MQLAFFIDVSACSGCKACQVACKDKHDLETGRLWRRVAEVEGGEWFRQGEAWRTTAFSYSVSLSCLHCQQPACVAGCPTGAMHKRDDGTVAVDADRCIGCRYCEWTCPYGAPRYDAASGRMSKCDFCADERREGRPPACVAACPMRALDFGDLKELEARHGNEGRDLYPLPSPALTQPSIVIRRHARAAGRPAPPRVGNREEL